MSDQNEITVTEQSLWNLKEMDRK